MQVSIIIMTIGFAVVAYKLNRVIQMSVPTQKHRERQDANVHAPNVTESSI